MYGCGEKADGAEFTCGIAWTRAAKRASYLPISYREETENPVEQDPSWLRRSIPLMFASWKDRLNYGGEDSRMLWRQDSEDVLNS